MLLLTVFGFICHICLKDQREKEGGNNLWFSTDFGLHEGVSLPIPSTGKTT